MDCFTKQRNRIVGRDYNEENEVLRILEIKKQKILLNHSP